MKGLTFNIKVIVIFVNKWLVLYITNWNYFITEIVLSKRRRDKDKKSTKQLNIESQEEFFS